MNTTDITAKAERLLINSTKTELSENLGITRPTLDTRLSGKSKWKKLEIKHINNLIKKKY